MLNELLTLTTEANKYATHKQVPAFTLEDTRELQLSLDGKPYRDTSFEIEVLPFILGPEAPLKHGGVA